MLFPLIADALPFDLQLFLENLRYFNSFRVQFKMFYSKEISLII